MNQQQLEVDIHLYILGRYLGRRRVTASPKSFIGLIANGDIAEALKAVQHITR